VNDGGRITLIALAVLLSLLLLPLTAAYRLGLDMRWVSGLLLGMSFWSYWLYAKDKRLARVQERRVPESVLHVTELLGGWPGAFLAQRRLRHKVAKPGYQLVFWVIVLSYQFASADSFQQWKYFKAAWDAIDRATEHRK
jgi:uncharacterized membrane protein YsdA (DUF1294 family)